MRPLLRSMRWTIAAFATCAVILGPVAWLAGGFAIVITGGIIVVGGLLDDRELQRELSDTTD